MLVSVARCLLLCLALAALVPPVLAEEVSIDHRGLGLVGSLELADGASLERDGAVLLVHGTLAHHRMEIMATLQALLKERGLNSLAITLSLGRDRRKGMYDCGLAHRHRHSGAQAEIAAWVAWLQAKGAGQVTLLGHSRGGNQVAIYGRTRPHEAVRRLVLIAPSTWTFEKAAKSYGRRSKVALSDRLEAARKLVAEGRGDQLLEDIPFLHCRTARVAAAAFVDYYAPNEDRFTPGILPSIERPVLVISGSADTVVPDLAQALQRLAPGKSVATKIIRMRTTSFVISSPRTWPTQ